MTEIRERGFFLLFPRKGTETAMLKLESKMVYPVNPELSLDIYP